MKHIRIPEDVPIVITATRKQAKNGDGSPATMSFEDFVLGMLTDKQCTVNAATLFKAVKIQHALEEANGYLELEDAHYDLLKQVVESPTDGYNPAWAISAVPFVEAVLNATGEKPKVPKELEPEAKGSRRRKRAVTVEDDGEEETE